MKQLLYWILLLMVSATFHAFGQSDDMLEYIEFEPASGFNRYDNPIDRGVTDRIFSMIYEGLIRYDSELQEKIPVLAERYNYNSLESSLTFFLRQNVKWHDGFDFTADDVKFTYDYLMTKPRFKKQYGFIKGIQVLNNVEIKFLFNKNDSSNIMLFHTWIIPQHKFDANFLPIRDNNGLSMNECPVGTGPFKFIRKNLDGNVQFKKNYEYWDSSRIPKLTDVRMLFQPDPQQAVNSLIYGEKGAMVKVPPEYIPLIESSGKFMLRPYGSYTIKIIAQNLRNPILKDSTLRKAMTIGTNRQTILEQFYANRGQLLFGPFTSYAPYYRGDLAPYPYDPDLARSILEQAGYVDLNGDGIRERKIDKAPLQFKLLIRISGLAVENTDQHVAENFITDMQSIGIKVEARNLVVDEYQQCLFETFDFDLAIMELTFDMSYNISPLFHSNEIYQNGKNFIGYRNPTIDLLLDRFHQTGDWAAKLKIMGDVQKLIRDDCPYLFMFTIDNYAALHRKFGGTHIDPYYFFTYFYEWFVIY